MLVALRSFLNKINQVLLIAFLLVYLIDNDEISYYVNLCFLVSIIIESFFLNADNQVEKKGEILFPKSLVMMMGKRLKTILYLFSVGALVYYIIVQEWNLESVINITLPLYFATFLKHMTGIRLGKDYLLISGMIQKNIPVKDISQIEWSKNQILIKSKNKTFVAKGLHPESIIEIQEYLFNNRINHIKVVV